MKALQRLDAARALLDRPSPAPVPGQLAVESGPRSGSLCTGYGGLDMAVQRVVGGSMAWASDIDPSACKILAHRFPAVPNLGDLTVVDWHHVLDTFGRPDIVTGGYPCQPFSIGGRQKGTADDRHIWPDIARALRVLRPRLAFLENVRNHLRIGFDVVLRDLAELGFDAEWIVVRASDALAPHKRERLFILAVAQDTDGEPWVEWRQSASRKEEGGRARSDARGRGRVAAADDHDVTARRREVARGVESAAGTDAFEARGGCGYAATVGTGEDDWGRFSPAVARWAEALGSMPPRPTDDRGRLNPELEEWMHGLPPGHVTQVPDLGRQGQLKAIGNGVVPQQGELALRLLLHRLDQDAQQLTP
ncbi:DNA (cytosine-5-)-methyltransferase [Streptomyces zaomyceticus]|uniref:DNA cytosine methyltransferase n=1 Tax=Streptomyces zaomyceticus TaxID=68286 RepID=UPI002E13B52E|nr:DNA (cytosine-5-)-methyltransferase [Streptomyces zaomyceticus]